MYEKTNAFYLNAWQQFLYIKGCITSASEQCCVFRFFIEEMQQKQTIEQQDQLWALVYRDIYLPYVTENHKPLFWDDMLRFLAAYNRRNFIRLKVKHPEYGNIAVRAYLFHGIYWKMYSTTATIPDHWIVAQFLRKEERQHVNDFLGLVKNEAYEDMTIY